MSSKWQVHYSTSLLLLFYMLSGRFADYMILVLSLFLHECGHFIAAKLARVDVVSVRFFIYGAEMRFRSAIISPNKQLVIAIGGPLATILVLLLFSGQNESYMPIVEMQKMLLLINLCPVWPLDGGRVVRAFIEHFFLHSQIVLLYLKISLGLSLLFIVLSFIWLNPFFALLWGVVCQQIWVELKNYALYNAYRRIVLQ